MADESFTQSPGAPRPLPVLRAHIDAVDRDVLALLAKRSALVSEVAQYKRVHQVRIRDASRERDILTDRRDRATPLGLTPEIIESLFRLILRGSRDRQAALKAEVPEDIEPKSIAIVGGKGQMGQCLARLFGDLGHAVMVADLDTELKPEEAASVADVVVISVPIDQTVETIRQLGPRVRPEGLLMDVTSVKEGPLAAMLEHSRASVVATHPLFDPSVHSLQGQRMVMCQGRGAVWHAWLTAMLRARGLVIKESTAAEHDEAMAVVQVLVHFATEVMGRTLARLGVGIEETLAFTSPIYLMELIMTARHFGQSSDLYGAIEMTNPKAPQVIDAFSDAAAALGGMIKRGDRQAFGEAFDDVRAFFGAFSDEAMVRSSDLIDRLVEGSWP